MTMRFRYRKPQSGLRILFTSVIGLLVLAAESGGQTAPTKDPHGNLVSLSATVFQPRAGTEDVPVTRYDGSLFGLHQANLFSPRDFYPPFFNGGGISSGDINRDGWPDILSANGRLITIFINQNGQRFVPLEIDVTGQDDTAIFNAVLVDLDNDGWLDIFGTTYLQGNFYLLSDKGAFSSAGLRQPPRGKSVLSAAVAFGDVDRDGDLDAVIGNWFAGASKKQPPPHAQNELWINEGDHFSITPLVELIGETLSTLLSDWSGDGWLDLIVGNDFDEPDHFYRGDGKGGFELIERGEGLIPYSTNTTMSIDTADFDNDLDLDIFIDQITARATGPSARIQMLPLEHYCDDIQVQEVRDRCVVNMATRQGFFYGSNHKPSNVRNCSEVADELDRRSCVGMQVMMSAHRMQDRGLCGSIPDTETRAHALCINFFEEVPPHDPDMLEQAIPQRMNENVFLAWDAGNKRFTDESKRLGVGFTGWSWNARFADVDNDEWQDIYVAAGSWFRATPSGTTANFFFHNEGGKRFSDQTDAFGLQNFMIVSAYTTLDFDRDGDLDFVTNSVNGPLWLLRNNTQKGNSIVFRLRDEVGNRDGIGTKFTVHYGSGGERHQMRELKASGGYISFDEPLVHFGLGQYDRIERMEISWSTGGKTEIPGPFAAGHSYQLQRSRPDQSN
ncbi:MAG: CRTAC1 family protein [Proteobacteria bacterium]|nr:CRTAC1 family protein [Pseudomonadota bacterium]